MKRARDADEPMTTTDAIVDAALKEEQQARRARVAARGRPGHDGQGAHDAPQDLEAFLSDSDVEDDQQGNLKRGYEDDDDIAETEEERARRSQAIKETARSMREAEEAFDDDVERQKKLKEDHGFELEAFNMREERATGAIDGEGNFVGGTRGREKPAAREPDSDDEDGEEGEGDGWLEGDQDKLVVDDATREKIEARRKEENENQGEKVIGPAELARWQYKLYKGMKGEETVAEALKRLGGGSQRKFLSAAARKRLERANKGGKKQSAEDRQAFEEITEYATLLMNQGDTDVYGRDRAYFKRAAGLYIDVSGDEGEDGEEEDMFA